MGREGRASSGCQHIVEAEAEAERSSVREEEADAASWRAEEAWEAAADSHGRPCWPVAKRAVSWQVVSKWPDARALQCNTRNKRQLLELRRKKSGHRERA